MLCWKKRWNWISSPNREDMRTVLKRTYKFKGRTTQSVRIFLVMIEEMQSPFPWKLLNVIIVLEWCRCVPSYHLYSLAIFLLDFSLLLSLQLSTYLSWKSSFDMYLFGIWNYCCFLIGVYFSLYFGWTTIIYARSCRLLPLLLFYFPSRMTINEVGLSDAALDALAQCFSRKPCEIKVCTMQSYWTLRW